MIDIDGYSAFERIGQGGLGDVYRATRDSTGGTVAIKVLRDVSDESVAWHRTRRELTALVSLAGHANVIQLFEVLDLPDGPALVMEYAPGGSVAELMLRRDRPLTVGETALVGRQTAAALVAAHAQGIVHRDVKPQNLLIDAYGQVKLCDFGIAAMARSEEFQVRTSAISMRYASPEDLDDEVDVGPASDVYSLGATLLHMARGAPPTLKERLAPWEPPATPDDELAALDAVIAACLRPTAADRPSASQVVDDLEHLGWSIEERNRALAFEPVDLAPETDDVTTDPRSAVADVIATLDADTATIQRPHADVDEATHDTVYRTDRRPPRPVVQPTRKRWPIAVGVVVAVGVLFGVILLLRQADTPTVEIVDRPSGLSAIERLEWPLGEVGECLVQRGDSLAATACTEPHDLQRTRVGVLDEEAFPVGAPFEERTVRDAVSTACTSAFEAFVGTPPEESSLESAFTAPSSETWAQDGDRSFQCLIGVTGMRMVGDAADGGA